jgi:hypothetical protein
MGSRQLHLISLTIALVVVPWIGCSKPQQATSSEPAGATPVVTVPAPVPAPHKPPRPNLITVGPKAKDVSPGHQTLHKDLNDQATWILVGQGQQLAASKKLYIEFEKQEVFPDAEPVPSGRYRVPCTGIVCQSGPIGEQVTYGEPGYKYWQVVVDAKGNEETADGIIIIDH